MVPVPAAPKTPAPGMPAKVAMPAPMAAPPAGSSSDAQVPAQGQVPPAPVTGGPLLKGVRRIGDRLHLQSLAIRSKTGTLRWVETSVDAHRYQDH